MRYPTRVYEIASAPATLGFTVGEQFSVIRDLSYTLKVILHFRLEVSQSRELPDWVS